MTTMTRVFIFLVFICCAVPAIAQQPQQQEDARVATLEQRVANADRALAGTEAALENALTEIKRLRFEIDSIKAEEASEHPQSQRTAQSSSVSESNLQDEVRALREDQEILRAEVKLHEQEKVETSSRYPLRVSGLMMFNAFSNAGVVDDVSVPTLALVRAGGGSHGTLGADVRQTLFAVDARGPHFGSASTSAHASFDFYGGQTYNGFGYRTSEGYARMRESSGSIQWPRTTLAVGYESPLISPLNPTSFAMVAAPSLSGSGNLWNWSPQVRVAQKIPLSGNNSVGIEAGLFFPDTPGYTSTQLNTPTQASRKPGAEGRLSFSRTSLLELPLSFGLGGYYAKQFYNATTQIHPWAITGDWQIPIASRLVLSGEIYRGAAIGGLGGGAYKDVLQGTDVSTGASRTVPVDTVGGWTQFKVRLSSTLQADAAFGMDDAMSRSFSGLNVSTTSNAFALYARNESFIGNIIFRPKTYLIVSPEYRHVQTWRHTGVSNVASIYTLSAGYQF